MTPIPNIAMHYSPSTGFFYVAVRNDDDTPMIVRGTRDEEGRFRSLDARAMPAPYVDVTRWVMDTLPSDAVVALSTNQEQGLILVAAILADVATMDEHAADVELRALVARVLGVLSTHSNIEAEVSLVEDTLAHQRTAPAWN